VLYGSLPQWIEPHDRGYVFFTRAQLSAAGTLDQPIVVFAETATHEFFYSKPTTLWGAAWKQELAELEEAGRRVTAKHERRHG
jgi:hypothetical protein